LLQNALSKDATTRREREVEPTVDDGILITVVVNRCFNHLGLAVDIFKIYSSR